MKILILEDSEERIGWFAAALASHDLTFSYEAQDCIDLLDTQTWDVLFLDHDLDGKSMQPSNSESGYGVACWLAKYPKRKPPLIVIHSMNFDGALKMRQALPEARMFPAAWIGGVGGIGL